MTFNILFFFVQAVICLAVTQGAHHTSQDESMNSMSFVPPGEIPGGSPLRLCNESAETDLYAIDHIELYPKPLYIDDVFEVHLYGTFLKNITDNATLTFTARYGNSTEQETGTIDFCGSLDSLDQPDPDRKQECPPETGFAFMSTSAWVMPMFFVPGDYYFRFDVVTKEDERIYCLDAKVSLDYEGKKDRSSSAQIDLG